MTNRTMQLDRRARKFAHWTIDAGSTPNLTYRVAFRDGVWHDLERTDDGRLRILVAGPDATGNPSGTVVLPLGQNPCTVLVPDAPEVDVEARGVIVVR